MGKELIRFCSGWRVRLLIGALTLCFADCAQSQSANSISIPTAKITVQQVTTNIPIIRFYMGARDAQDKLIENLTKGNVRVNAAGSVLPVESLTPFRKMGGGVAYALLIDDSGSIKGFLPQIKDAARIWTQQLGDDDKIALVKIGSSRETPEFVSGSPQLIQALDGFTGSEDRTLLYDSLDRTLHSFADTRGLPQRRAIVVITDGQDDDDISGTTSTTLTRDIEDAGIPIFAIGVTAVHSAPRADQAIKTLAEMAVRSHGVFIPLNGGAPGEVYDAFHQRILDVYAAEVKCNACPHDGEPHPLQVMVRDGRSDAMLVPFNGPGISWYKQTWVLAGIAALLVALVVVVWIATVIRRRESERRERELAAEAENRAGVEQLLEEQRRLQAELQELTAMQSRAATVTLPEPYSPPPPPLKVVLSVIRKPELTRVLELHERITIGRAELCDFRVADDRIGDYECEIRRANGQVSLTNPDGSLRQVLLHQSEFFVGSTKVRWLDRMIVDLSGRQGQGDRDEQQDALGFGDPAWRPGRGVVGVVADGVGGLRMGGEASRLAVDAFLDVWKNHTTHLEPVEALEKSLKAASDAVLSFGRRMDVKERCASTIVAAAIEDWDLWWVAAGDSRAYLLRGSRLNQLTADHNRMMTLYDQVAAGMLSRRQAEEDAERGWVTSALGMPELPQVDRNSRPIRLMPGDRVLLCTDGVYLAITEEEITKTCAQGDSQACCEAIVRLVAKSGNQGQDNYSVILMTLTSYGTS